METKIIATIGPATLDPKIFNQLVKEGISYVRINTSYGDYNQYDQILKNITESKSDIKVVFDIKKLESLKYFVKNKLETVAVSFSESADQLKEARAKVPYDFFLISKIESKKGVENFPEILDASDGVMVARGDLGEAVTLEDVPPLQKKFTYLTLKKGKFLIAATEMLLSMAKNPTPTRAEVSDVANAVFDKVSAVMLSEETAIGRYPIESVRYMRKIIEKAEEFIKQNDGVLDL